MHTPHRTPGATIAPDAARDLASSLLAESARRRAHDLAAGELCDRVARSARVDDRTLASAAAAAYLHDVGYAEPLKQTGFHPLDGARYLRSRGWDVLARLVAHHSQAHLQAAILGLSLADFAPVGGVLQDLVDYADLRAGPDGSVVSVEVRLWGIAERHDPSSAPARALAARRPLVDALVRRIEDRCGGDPLAGDTARESGW